ncbi:MAG: N-acetyl-gamma-glutamyl-phosphate reductase [Candidatus Kapabacteria bacterium]|nr:N-acetyl-gamma-glutamyl-phosphate reductase [Candidatus Kapabacteria bacterium]
MIRAAVIGAAGYTGGELIRLLLRHPNVGQAGLTAVSTSSAGRRIGEVHPDLSGSTDLRCTDHHGEPDVVFLCLGHGQSSRWLAENTLAAHVRVVDLSTDHRDLTANPGWTYGLPEKYRQAIRGSSRVANPGCFATAIELALLPLAETGLLTGDVVVHAITGSTGAGAQPSETTHYAWRESNVSTYKTFAHQHEAEIRQVLGDVRLHFVPLRGPFTRGIHATSVIPGMHDLQQAISAITTRYAEEPYVHVVSNEPAMKAVVNTNNCHIGLTGSNGTLCIVSCIDNLLKGASGQAVQNMNLMFGFDETAGLNLKASVY